MSWTNGIYFSKNDETQTKEFLEAQGLNENQIKTVEIYFKQKAVSYIYFWTGGIGSVAFFVGFIFAIQFFR